MGETAKPRSDSDYGLFGALREMCIEVSVRPYVPLTQTCDRVLEWLNRIGDSPASIGPALHPDADIQFIEGFVELINYPFSPEQRAEARAKFEIWAGSMAELEEELRTVRTQEEPRFVEHTQHAVGQGGFMSVRISYYCMWTDAYVSKIVVYDCGSRNTRTLRARVGSFHESLGPTEKPNVVVLSHLDSDHANGAELLLSRSGADVVILPYLTTAERLLLAARELSAGSMRNDAAERLVDPVQWARRRGAQRVVLVVPPDTPRPFEPSDGDGDWDGSPIRGVASVRSNGREVPDGMIESGGRVGVVGDAEPIWEVAFYNKPVAKERRKALEAMLVDTHDSPDAALNRLRWDEEARKKLVETYRRSIRYPANDMSLCMWSGPIGVGPGWLSTGDLPLCRPRDVDDLVRGLGTDRIKRVEVFVLPHHGSARSFTPTTLDQVLAPRSWVAAAGNTRHHPARKLMDDLPKRCGAVHTVSSDASSSFVWGYQPSSIEVR